VIKKLIVVGMLLVMALSFLPACGPTESPGAFYTLQEAYDNGWLTAEDLRSIAYYHHGGQKVIPIPDSNGNFNPYGDFSMVDEEEGYAPLPKNPEVLSAETEKQIKQTMNLQYDLKYKLKDIYIKKYNGTYNDCIAVMMDYKYMRSHSGSLILVADVAFAFGSSNRIKIWKENES